MANDVPKLFLALLSTVHPSWRPILSKGLEAITNADPTYLAALAQDSFLPTQGRIFAAFSMPIETVRYVLIGEGPYPREESATGVCFMDGAVNSLWSEKGLSKQVNRATSLRNFMKMLLVANGQLASGNTSGEALMDVAAAARAEDSSFIQTLAELESNLVSRGFLLLNAALVYRPHVPPVKDVKAWQPFMRTVLAAMADRVNAADAPAPTLVLWGKLAEQLNALPEVNKLPKLVAEHPYNLSFIKNESMQRLFGDMHLLEKSDKNAKQ